MEGDVEKRITYFRYCGEVNTEKVLQKAKLRCEETGVSKVVIASETGRSAIKALSVFKGTKIKLIVVTHYPAKTWGPKGDIPIGLKRKEYAEALKKLEENGVKIVQGTRPFAPPTRSINWEYPTPEGIIDKTLEIFGAGTKIAIEAAVMATDAGEVDAGEEIVSCAGTYKGLDTALVVKTANSGSFFREFEVREIIAKPICRVRALPEYKYENWKGNLDQYYL
ncbi:MAG: pyruvate kinase alpha/beta domain-containing protein [Candidatus Bathyarchaeota archaeon]|nr:pyruvate kinase alpha/beta domain-containing protein [Candidatus Bathyarchaeota archaeon]MDI6805536.1 pyruvate kinase alpha/beta domain-containing protein [Candidatus Bathyarchaeia archaeon]